MDRPVTNMRGTPVPGAHEMSVYDAEAIRCGCTGLSLMERAGSRVAERILRNPALPALGREILILCGPGNNGGDGLVLARKLLEKGRPPLVIVAGASTYREEFLVNLSRLSTFSKIFLFDEENSSQMDLSLPRLDSESLKTRIGGVTLLVDALLGTGQSGPLRGNIKSLLECVQAAIRPPFRICIDVPTGVNATSGEVYQGGVIATETICIQFVKRGLLQYPARRRVGELQCIDIGIKASKPAEFSLLDRDSAIRLRRRKDAHKGQAGTLVVVAGHADMPGAAYLTALAAIRSGAGLVKIAIPRGCRDHTLVPEAIFVPVKSERELSAVDFGILRDECSAADAVVIGPGLGVSSNCKELLRRLLAGVETPLVLDADGLNILSEYLHEPGQSAVRENWILTPHPGEFSRLSGFRTADVQKDRYTAFLNFTSRIPAVLVLKGAGTLVGQAGYGWVQQEGNPFMATAGAGDILAGVIGGLLSQGIAPLEAARLGVLIHGQAGDAASGPRGRPLRSMDILDAIPEILPDYFEAV